MVGAIIIAANRARYYPVFPFSAVLLILGTSSIISPARAIATMKNGDVPNSGTGVVTISGTGLVGVFSPYTAGEPLFDGASI